MRQKPRWDAPRIVEAIRAFHAATGTWPEHGDFCAAQGLPAPDTVQRHLGTLEDAGRQAGRSDAMHQPPRWDAARIVEAIRAYHAALGTWPVQGDCCGANHLPAVSTIEWHLGSLAEARRQAGMPGGGWEGVAPWEDKRRA